jgi:hypothetical protein
MQKKSQIDVQIPQVFVFLGLKLNLKMYENWIHKCFIIRSQLNLESML